LIIHGSKFLNETIMPVSIRKNPAERFKETKENLKNTLNF